MSAADIIQIIIGVLSLIATIAVSFLIYWLQTRHEKEIRKLQEEKDRIELETKARKFLIDNESERDYLAWCIIAANQHPLERHSRKIYTEYCRCTEELQNEILRQAGYNSRQIKDTRWVQNCIAALENDIKRFDLGGNYLYDGAKYFHRSYEYYRDLEWNCTPRVFKPINKDNRCSAAFNMSQLSIADYVDEYFYYYIDGRMEFGDEKPTPPMDLVWFSQNLGTCKEELVCMWLMELIESIAIIVTNRKPDEEINQNPLEYTGAQAETFEDKYYEVLQALYNAYYVSVAESKSKKRQRKKE